MPDDCATCGELPGNPDCEVCEHDGWTSGRARELNWQDCRDAATDAAANLAHCFNSIETPELDQNHREAWIEEQVIRAMRVGRQRAMRHFIAEAIDDPTPVVTGERFER